MNKEQAIEAAKSADQSNMDWASEIVDQLDSKYAQGYLSAKLEQLGNCLSSSSGDFKEEFISFLEYDIWK